MDEHVLGTYLRAEEVFVSGHGAVLTDRTGREWIDCLGGIAVSALGHGHPRLVEALQDQVGKVIHLSNLFRHPYTEEVAARLARWTGLHSVFFTNSGTEANEAALKLARKYQRQAGRPERMGFVALEGGFHGRTMGALSVTHTPKYRAPFEPLIPLVRFVKAGDIEALEQAVHETMPAALIYEPIQGESGVRMLPAEYLRFARALCDKTGTVLIHDEVQCGSGRTGTFLCGDHAGVKPDVATLAKPIAAGLPMGLMMVAEKFKDTFVPGDHGSTFAGGPLACRGALVFLEELEHGLLDAVVERGRQLRAGLDQLARQFPVIAEVRGLGLMAGLRLTRDATALQQHLYRHGLICNVAGGDVLRLLPPYVITGAQIEQSLKLLATGLEAITELPGAVASPPRP